MKNVILISLFALLASCNAGEEKIVGGKKARVGEFPYQVAWVLKTYRDDPFYGQFCGGSLIHPDGWVLTAGHCFRDVQTNTDTDPNTIYALMDTIDIGSRDPEATERDILNVYIHPTYTTNTPDNQRVDIALVQLASSVSGIRWTRICEAADAANLEAVGNVATVSGWGSITADSSTGNYPTDLYWVEIPLVDIGTCRSEAPFVISDDYICAGSSGKDSCQGDSGGPLTVPDPNAQPIQIGVVSSGTAVSQPLCTGIYGIYTRVCPYSNWITGYTGTIPTPPNSGSLVEVSAALSLAAVGLTLAFM